MQVVVVLVELQQYLHPAQVVLVEVAQVEQLAHSQAVLQEQLTQAVAVAVVMLLTCLILVELVVQVL
jgi:hypothetical protein